MPDGAIKVVQHALTPAEKQYGQPDREGLAIVYAVTKFHRIFIFARFGMPNTLVSDNNGVQFKSAEFASFCIDNAIDHITTAPYHPQSNGQAERFIDTFKRAIRKIRQGGEDIQAALDNFLLTYRTIPNPSTPNAPPVQVANKDGKLRSFDKGDRVYDQIHTKNTWRWAPAKV
ncbi:uncharacterized protein K02A2.6-like [Armigeres subalbatus]|uniref:uncharacterized protein K02A2.6-like n=1 Tax=Armigeres subalbatus TaxID=124917 RepID=UPI002ED48C17